MVHRDNQVKNWFFWFLFVFVVITLLTEYVKDEFSSLSMLMPGRINYLNKALELFK